MRWFAPLFILVSVVSAAPASAQTGGLLPPGDFRVNQGPGTAPTVGPPGGPSLPAGPTQVPDPTGTKPPPEILNQLDKQLGSGTLGSGTMGSSMPSSSEPGRRDMLDRR